MVLSIPVQGTRGGESQLHAGSSLELISLTYDFVVILENELLEKSLVQDDKLFPLHTGGLLLLSENVAELTTYDFGPRKPITELQFLFEKTDESILLSAHNASPLGIYQLGVVIL